MSRKFLHSEWDDADSDDENYTNHPVKKFKAPKDEDRRRPHDREDYYRRSQYHDEDER